MVLIEAEHEEERSTIVKGEEEENSKGVSRSGEGKKGEAAAASVRKEVGDGFETASEGDEREEEEGEEKSEAVAEEGFEDALSESQLQLGFLGLAEVVSVGVRRLGRCLACGFRLGFVWIRVGFGLGSSKEFDCEGGGLAEECLLLVFPSNRLPIACQRISFLSHQTWIKRSYSANLVLNDVIQDDGDPPKKKLYDLKLPQSRVKFDSTWREAHFGVMLCMIMHSISSTRRGV